MYNKKVKRVFLLCYQNNMNKKSLESHQARRSCANYQRGNTKVQRAIASIIMKLPDSTKDVLTVFKNST